MMAERANPKREYWVRDILAMCSLAERAARGLDALRETYKSHIPTVSQLTSVQERVARMVVPVRESVHGLGAAESTGQSASPSPSTPPSAAPSTPPNNSSRLALNAFAPSFTMDAWSAAG